MKQGWIVVRCPVDGIIPQNGRPSIIHDSFDLAIAEAERLTKKEHCEFLVFQLCGIVREISPPIEWDWL